jgi:hypothetical protein
MCAHHAERLAHDLSASPALTQGFLESEVEDARAAVSGLGDLGGFKNVVKVCLDLLEKQLTPF